MASDYGAIPTAVITSQQDSAAGQPEASSKWPLLRRPRTPKRSTQLSLAFLILISAGALLLLQNELFERIKRPLPIHSDEYHYIPIHISHLFNNIAAGPGADFDPHYHSHFAAEHLPTTSFTYDGVKFILPSNWSDGQPDNVIPHGETIHLGKDSTYIRELHVLYAGDWIDGESGNKFTLNYEDGSSEQVEVSAKNWWTLHWLNQGVIRTPYHYRHDGTKNHNLTMIYHWSAGTRSQSPVVSISLPQAHWPNHFHLFSLSLVPSHTNPRDHKRPPKIPLISIRRQTVTTKWRTIDGVKAYAIELSVVNPLPSRYTRHEGQDDGHLWIKGPFYFELEGDDMRTVQPGMVARIMPGDEAKVKVWVEVIDLNEKTKRNGGRSLATVIVRDAKGAEVYRFGRYDLGFEKEGGLARRLEENTLDTPEWWDDAKFGILWWMHKWTNADNGFWRYHRDHYGTKFEYDDFIDMFNPTKFNASEWIDLFAESGAKYFVLVTKHHDGWALFDTKNTTHRSTYHLGPKRDYIRELFDAAKNERPELKRGTYITMPEWYNPDAGSGGYGFGDWPGQLAHNAYDYSKLEPYRGRLPGKDYLRDNQLEHMRMLARDYESEIMWCDIGGPNLTKEFAAEWYPFAESQGRQVVMNNRCGDLPQFDTPEYTRFSSIQSTKWETSEGIDPYCYAFNRDTKPEEYKSAQTVLHSLIDIVSKNGNYLIGLGPTGDGDIFQPVVERMLDVGKWLKHSGECVYGTKYFFPGAEHGPLRFTQTETTFCIISLIRPENGKLVVGRDVPILKGDKISLLGGGDAGEDLNWRVEDGGKLVVDVPKKALDKVDLAWAFKVEYAL
ncbi:hypothetical protein FRC01_005210 [Tulasnella sp. 417]|nr:hypothetical protein FRC01_005210 [Tulasnella sp. 417]